MCDQHFIVLQIVHYSTSTWVRVKIKDSTIFAQIQFISCLVQFQMSSRRTAPFSGEIKTTTPLFAVQIYKTLIFAKSDTSTNACFTLQQKKYINYKILNNFNNKNC